MEALKLIRKTREYLDYIEEHVLNIQNAWSEIQVKCRDMRFVYDDFVYNWISMEVQRHDVSKLSPEEFVQYRRQFYPANDREKGCGFDEAWENHKYCNPHHWETWTKETYTNPYEWEVHCVHMVIDWTAMGYKFGDTAQKYYEANKDKINLPNYAENFIYEIFERIKNNEPGRHETTSDDTREKVSTCNPSCDFPRRKARTIADLRR